MPRRTPPVLALLFCVLAVLVSCNKDSSPTAPTPPPPTTPPPTPPPPVIQNINVLGVVTDSNTGRPIGGARVRATSGSSSGSATTDGNGFYQVNGLIAGQVTLNFEADRYNGRQERPTFATAGDHRFDTNIAPFFRRTGRGNNVFDLPSYVQRIRIRGVWDRRDTSNFIVRIGGRSILNEILRSTITYDGVHATPGGGVVEIISSTNIDWEFIQEQ